MRNGSPSCDEGSFSMEQVSKQAGGGGRSCVSPLRAEVGGQDEKPLTSKLHSIVQPPLITARAAAGPCACAQNAEGGDVLPKAVKHRPQT